MSARGQQDNGGRPVRTVLETGRKQVPFHVIDADEGFAQAPCQRLGERIADHQRAHETGPLSRGNSVYVIGVDAGLAQCLVDERSNRLDVGAGGHLGNDASEAGVNVGLGGEHG